MTHLTRTALSRAQDVLQQCISPIGIKASALESGYPQVWARDSMITMLGAVQLPGPEVQAAVKQCLVTLQEHQTDQGAIPSNVGVNGGCLDFRAYIDGNLWYIIGHHTYWRGYGDREFLATSWPRIERTFNWLYAQDVYQSNLIAMQEGSDWMDQMSIHGLGLCVNVLFYRALICASELAAELGHTDAATRYQAKAGLVYDALQKHFWVDMAELPHGLTGRFELEENDIVWGRKVSIIRERPYFLPYLGFRDLGHWFDTLGNLLAVLYGVATTEQAEQILRYIQQVGNDSPYPARAIYPAIYPGDPDWRDYYLNRNLNVPNQYHNGGIWPFVGGFYVAALVKHGDLKEATAALEQLAEANRQGKQGEWEFNEWLHGVTGRPMGQELQGWSAGMYVYAHHCVQERRVPFLESKPAQQVG
jgi:glycogen debranching enzyme